MSQTEAPTEEITTNPVGTQDSTVGEKSPAERAIADADLKKAVAEAVSDMFKPQAWKPKILVKFKIELPSGQKALVKHLDTLDLLEYDLIEELDFFTRKLFPATVDMSGNPIEQDKMEENIWKALTDPDKRRRFLDMTGKLMAAASLDPKIVHDGVALVKSKRDGRLHTRFGYQLNMDQQLEYLGEPVSALRDREVYSGYIDFSDRMVFFQELNRPLESITPFRKEQAQMLQDLARGEGDGGEAK